MTGSIVDNCRSEEGAARVELDNGSHLNGDMALVTGLRRANFPEGLEKAGVDHDGQKIGVNSDLQTSCENIGAVRGITEGAVRGITEGAVRGITEGAVRRVGDRNIAAAGPPYPRAIYTLPEIAGAGYQETELNAAGIPYKCHRYRIGDTWRGFSKGIDEGFVKILSGQNDRILGIWMCGGDASELASLFGALVSKNVTVGELLHSLILHPTLGEAFLEAAMELD
jgi:dihydrolipoamide dehydrogenase